MVGKPWFAVTPNSPLPTYKLRPVIESVHEPILILYPSILSTAAFVEPSAAFVEPSAVFALAKED